MNKIIIHEPYTNIEIKFGLEDLSINIYEFAKDFLKDNYDIDFKIHFELVDNIPNETEDETGVTTAMLVIKNIDICNGNLYKIADRIELLKPFFEIFHSRVLLDTIKHELVHYALFEKYGKGYNDGEELFESECKRLGIE